MKEFNRKLLNLLILKGLGVLISLVAAVVVISNSALAGDRVAPINSNPTVLVSTPLGCSLEHNKEFTQAVVIKNITKLGIPDGKIVSIRVYYNGKVQGKLTKYTLPQPLAPGQSIRTSDEISSVSSANYTCKASY